MTRGIRIFALLLAALVLLPAVALAHRRSTKPERAAILAAVVEQRQLSKAQAACQVVTISTVNETYSALNWPGKLSSACLRVAANGVIIEHRTPAPVASDLRVCLVAVT